MYIVDIINGGVSTTIHGKYTKLASGKINKGINAIDSFTFSMLPNSPGFTFINEFTTHVTVYNTNKNRYEFMGRVLYAETTMEDDGLITKTVTCENLFGFLCDSWQTYTDTQNWTVAGLLQHIIDCHNSQVEEYKHFKIGNVTAKDNNDNLYQAVQRERTWDSIKSKLLDKIGGELQFRVESDGIYLDYLEKIGEEKQTAIALSKNMKSITKEQDPTEYVTRLIPLGCKLVVDGKETEHRLDISSIQSGGVNYIDDEDAILRYGIHVKVVEWDDVTTASALLNKGRNWMAMNNWVNVKYAVTALDLSLIGLAVDDFDVGNTHPVVNGLIGVNDVARIIKKTVDVCDETQSTIEVGDSLKALTDIQVQQSQKLDKLAASVGTIQSDYVTNQALITESMNTSSKINQSANSVLASVEEIYAKTSTIEEHRLEYEAQLELLSNAFSVRIQEAETQINKVDNTLQDRLNEITKYFTFDVNGLTIGQINNPNRVVIDNDKIKILVKGMPVQEFNADGTGTIPTLHVSSALNLLGLHFTSDETHINCDYIEGVIANG